MPIQTVEEVARRALAQVASTAPLNLATLWAQERYRELAGHIRFPHLRKDLEISIPASITAGTATFTQASTTVTGNAAAQAVWTSDLDDRYFIRDSGGSQWYQVRSRTGSDIALKTAFAAATATASGYELVRRYHALPSDVRWVSERLVSDRLRRQVLMISLDQLDREAPGRPVVANVPLYWSPVGTDAFGNRIIEVYPPADDEAQILRGSYWPHPPELDVDEPLPPSIDARSLKEGVLLDVLDWEAGTARKVGRMEIAAEWRRRRRDEQIPLWEAAIDDLIAQDRQEGSSSLWLEGYGSSPQPFNVTRARDEIYLLRGVS